MASWLVAIMLVGPGCRRTEMPIPPAAATSSQPEVQQFQWAMERLEHAFEMFRPPSTSGIRVDREIEYEIFPPDEKQKKYTAQVTLLTKTIFQHSAPESSLAKKKLQAKQAKELAALRAAEADPFAQPGDDLEEKDLPLVQPKGAEIIEPRVPSQKLEKKLVCNLEYRQGKWRLIDDSPELEDVQMWFDYALQQGEYEPE